jgi:hypothetical protein
LIRKLSTVLTKGSEMVVVAYRGKIWNLMKVILLHNTEGHDGVHAQICRKFVLIALRTR